MEHSKKKLKDDKKPEEEDAWKNLFVKDKKVGGGLQTLNCCIDFSF